MPHDLLQFAPLASMLAAAAIVFYRRQIHEALERFDRRGPRPPTGLLTANDSLSPAEKAHGADIPARALIHGSAQAATRRWRKS